MVHFCVVCWKLDKDATLDLSDSQLCIFGYPLSKFFIIFHSEPCVLKLLCG